MNHLHNQFRERIMGKGSNNYWKRLFWSAATMYEITFFVSDAAKMLNASIFFSKLSLRDICIFVVDFPRKYVNFTHASSSHSLLTKCLSLWLFSNAWYFSFRNGWSSPSSTSFRSYSALPLDAYSRSTFYFSILYVFLSFCPFIFYFSAMTNFVIRLGLNGARTLQNSQVVLIGTKSHLKALQFDKNLAMKLQGVDENLFKAALGKLEKASSVPLYLNVAKVRISFLPL